MKKEREGWKGWKGWKGRGEIKEGRMERMERMERTSHKSKCNLFLTIPVAGKLKVGENVLGTLTLVNV